MRKFIIQNSELRDVPYDRNYLMDQLIYINIPRFRDSSMMKLSAGTTPEFRNCSIHDFHFAKIGAILDLNS